MSIVDESFLHLMNPQAEQLRVIFSKTSLDDILASDLEHEVEAELVDRGVDTGSALLSLMVFIVM